MLAKLSSSNKCILYQNLIENVGVQYYLMKPINNVVKRNITLAHKVYLEKGRHSYIARENRLCKCCNRSNIEAAYTTSFLYARVI